MELVRYIRRNLWNSVEIVITTRARETTRGTVESYSLLFTRLYWYLISNIVWVFVSFYYLKISLRIPSQFVCTESLKRWIGFLQLTRIHNTHNTKVNVDRFSFPTYNLHRFNKRKKKPILFCRRISHTREHNLDKMPNIVDILTIAYSCVILLNTLWFKSNHTKTINCDVVQWTGEIISFVRC